MKSKTALFAATMSFVLCMCIFGSVGAQQPPQEQEALPILEEDREAIRDGVFVVTLKTPERRSMTIDELVRDRDLNPRSLYRVKTGGYIGFDESEWVDRIEFKVFERPVTEMEEYKRFSSLLVDINEKIWSIKRTLEKYDLLALRLMNLCDRSKFSSLEAIDDNVLRQLTIYRKLLLLRSLVLNALSRFQRERACTDLYTDYQRTLGIYEKQLTELTKNYNRLQRKALTLARQVRPAAEKAAEQRLERSDQDQASEEKQ
ncbi:MAG: hypothetical protein RDU20_03345 [Desulfomonilaceae bacterium]|nr:hypothetical protein [Desulfomonilaceae bacterium]